MNLEQGSRADATLNVENIGGIDETSVTFSPGVTLLAGRNATNRTSLLQALMAALGSNQATVKGDADKGTVELSIGDETYSRTLSRKNGTVQFDGNPYLQDSTLADLFAFLLESNEVRRAVARNANLREFIMRPIDTEEIKAEIEHLVARRQELEQELEAIESQKTKLPELEERRSHLQDEIEAKQAELAEKEESLEAADADLETTRNEKQILEEKLTDLRSRRADLEDIRYDIQTERETLDSLKAEQSSLEEEYAELPEVPANELRETRSKIEQLRERKQRVESQIDELQSVIRFNEGFLNAENDELFDVLEETDDQSIPNQLLADQEITCWTCGSTVDTDQIEATIGQLRGVSEEKLEDINEIDERLNELTERRNTLKDQQSKRERIENRLTEIDDEIEETEEALSELQNRRDELTRAVADIEAEVEEIEGDAYSKILDLHKEANQLEYEIGELESDLDRVEDEITEVEAQIGQQEAIEADRESVQEDIKGLRTRIDRIEKEAVEEFNEHMETVLDLLDYANLSRIWIERVEEEIREGRQKTTQNVFTLHVVRSSDTGITYEDSIDHLSESEREVTGLVFALAGYLAHDVADTVPFMLLDSLEAIDSERIATLIEYLSDHTEYTVAALLLEDAAALDTDHQRITPE